MPNPPPPLKNHKAIGFLRNASPEQVENHKATKPAFIDGPSSTRQWNAISIAFHWRADDGPILVVLGSPLPSSTKIKMLIELGPLWQNVLDPLVTWEGLDWRGQGLVFYYH